MFERSGRGKEHAVARVCACANSSLVCVMVGNLTAVFLRLIKQHGYQTGLNKGKEVKKCEPCQSDMTWIRSFISPPEGRSDLSREAARMLVRIPLGEKSTKIRFMVEEKISRNSSLGEYKRLRWLFSRLETELWYNVDLFSFFIIS